MVTHDQLKYAFSRYVDAEFVQKVSGLKKWLIALAMPEILNTMDKMIETNKEMLISRHYMHPDGMLDIDKIYHDIREIAYNAGEVVEHMPLIGDVKFTYEDIDKIYRYM